MTTSRVCRPLGQWLFKSPGNGLRSGCPEQWLQLRAGVGGAPGVAGEAEGGAGIAADWTEPQGDPG